jgi:hypothetical protein
MVFPNLIMVPDDEEDPEEMIPKEDEPAGASARRRIGRTP